MNLWAQERYKYTTGSVTVHRARTVYRLLGDGRASNSLHLVLNISVQ